MLAHVNSTGQNFQIWLDSAASQIGWGLSSTYPCQEGTFMGNIFTTSTTVFNANNQAVVEAYYCEGPDFANGTVAGRLGDSSQSDIYANAYGGYGSPPPRCDQKCAKADVPNDKDGYKQCAQLAPTGLHGSPRVGNHTITVWRGPGAGSVANCSGSTSGSGGSGGSSGSGGSGGSSYDYDFENTAQGWAPGAATTAQHASGSYALGMGIGSGTTRTSVRPSTSLTGGKPVTMKVWVPSSGVSSIQAYVQDANWIWTGTFNGSPYKGGWNTITVTVPGNATMPLQALGVEFVASASANVYVDSVNF
jgi:hypothetical protein